MHSHTHPARTPHKHARFRTLHMLNMEKLAHVHNQGLEICLGQPHNDIWHVCRRYEGVVAALEQSRWVLATFVTFFFFFHKLCIFLRAETSCKHSGTHSKKLQINKTGTGLETEIECDVRGLEQNAKTLSVESEELARQK